MFSDYEREIRYHPGKANVVVDALSRMEMNMPRRIREMRMTIQYSIKGTIPEAQKKSLEQANFLSEKLHGLYQQIEKRGDEAYTTWIEYRIH